MSVSGATHLRGIVIAGALAAVALVGGYFTLVMNQTASPAAVTTTILPLKDRHPASARTSTTAATTAAKPAKTAKMPAKAAPKAASTTATTAATKPATKPVAKAKAKVTAKPKPKPVSPYLKEALAAGLPRAIAEGLAQAPVVVVELTTKEDSLAEEGAAEAEDGAKLGGAAYVPVSVDTDNATVQALTRLLEQVPDAPAALIYTRPGTLALTLTGYVDRTVIEQAVASEKAAAAGTAGTTGSSSSSSGGASTTTAAPTTAGASA